MLDRFVRLEGSRSRPGSGLGLSLAAAVARMHGGSGRARGQRAGPARACRCPPSRAPLHCRRRRTGAWMSPSLAEGVVAAPRLASPAAARRTLAALAATPEAASRQPALARDEGRRPSPRPRRPFALSLDPRRRRTRRGSRGCSARRRKSRSTRFVAALAASPRRRRGGADARAAARQARGGAPDRARRHRRRLGRRRDDRGADAVRRRRRRRRARLPAAPERPRAAASRSIRTRPILRSGSGIVVLALGKHGARELNYSSDIDLIVLYDAAAASIPAGRRACAALRAHRQGARAPSAGAHERRLRAAGRLAAAARSRRRPRSRCRRPAPTPTTRRSARTGSAPR